MEDINIDKLHKPRYKKYGIKYDICIGTSNKNPNKSNQIDRMRDKPRKWLWYDGYWYIINNDVTKEKLEKDCYCQEQFLERLIEIIN